MIRRLHKFLDEKQKNQSYLLFCLMFFASGLEFLSIGLILPIIGIFDSESTQLLEILNFLKIYFHEENLLLKVLFLFVSIFIIKTLILVLFHGMSKNL